MVCSRYLDTMHNVHIIRHHELSYVHLLGNNTVIMYILILFTFYFMNLCVYVCSVNYMVLLQSLVSFLKNTNNSSKKTCDSTDINIMINGRLKRNTIKTTMLWKHIITNITINRNQNRSKRINWAMCFSSFMPDKKTFLSAPVVTLYIHSGRNRRTVVNKMLLYS